MSWLLLNVGLDASAPASIAPANPFLAVFPATREGEEAAGRFAIEAGAQSVGRIAKARLEGDGLVVPGRGLDRSRGYLEVHRRGWQLRGAQQTRIDLSRLSPQTATASQD